ncbi:hypothetical protein LO80_06555 [Candidatus Francisella endociliophora]|uniref:Uncharacterized protein n=1 Tax=Candidatus Francisella endociliophora TaxID=653937 RepID=A0A097EQ37_9GAMM|nr:pentapeptide repeat-containing protein [Francisella sp. FSC1006]AIT09656.1 hypothetical protein LO80_06555 [Francisella sp. FSC1006]
MSDDKKKKRPLDDYVANILTVQEIDHEGEYGPEPELYNVPLGPDMVDEILEYPVELCSINSFVYDKLWTKPAYDSLLDKVKKLNKDWQDKTIDTIDHQDTDFSSLIAEDSAIVSNKYTSADFSDAKFARAKIVGGKYDNCTFTNTQFNATQIGQSEFNNCQFDNVNFDKATIKNVVFKNCTFTKCSFVSTQLHTTDLHDCKIMESKFNKEMWFRGDIINAIISQTEFNKSQFSGMIIRSSTLSNNSFLKVTFFASQIEDSSLSNNLWLKVGFANGNSIYKTTLYNENIQQCNFGDSEWKDSEVQNSQFLKNDFSKVEMHDTDFTGINGIGDNFATGIFANCKFMDCDLAQANCTGTDFIVSSSIQNCTLDKLIYAYANLPKNFDESQLKRTSQAQVKPLTDKDLRKPRDAEDSDKDTSKPLRNLPDRDAAVLCELVYESSMLESIAGRKDTSLADLIYNEDKKTLDKDVKALLSKDDDGSLSTPLDDYANYYQPVLAKYKLVAVSPSSSDGYFSIAIANKDDNKNRGIYIITRGSDNTPNYLSDIKMSVSSLPAIFNEAISFTKSILASNDNVKYLGFSGHSLGGSVSQAQVVYFEAEKDKKYTISPSKNFEPFGIGNILSGMKVGETAKEANNFTGIIYVTADAELANRYKGSPKAYSSIISNYYRAGDLVSEQELNSILGNITKIETNYSFEESLKRARKFDVSETPKWWEDQTIRRSQNDANTQLGMVQILKDRMYYLHTMTNYRYQGFSPSLVKNSFNTTNVEILMTKGNKEDKENYNFVFQAMSSFKEIK